MTLCFQAHESGLQKVSLFPPFSFNIPPQPQHKQTTYCKGDVLEHPPTTLSLHRMQTQPRHIIPPHKTRVSLSYFVFVSHPGKPPARAATSLHHSKRKPVKTLFFSSSKKIRRFNNRHKPMSGCDGLHFPPDQPQKIKTRRKTKTHKAPKRNHKKQKTKLQNKKDTYGKRVCTVCPITSLSRLLFHSLFPLVFFFLLFEMETTHSPSISRSSMLQLPNPIALFRPAALSSFSSCAQRTR